MFYFTLLGLILRFGFGLFYLQLCIDIWEQKKLAVRYVLWVITGGKLKLSFLPMRQLLGSYEKLQILSFFTSSQHFISSALAFSRFQGCVFPAALITKGSLSLSQRYKAEKDFFSLQSYKARKYQASKLKYYLYFKGTISTEQ